VKTTRTSVTEAENDGPYFASQLRFLQECIYLGSVQRVRGPPGGNDFHDFSSSTLHYLRHCFCAVFWV